MMCSLILERHITQETNEEKRRVQIIKKNGENLLSSKVESDFNICLNKCVAS